MSIKKQINIFIVDDNRLFSLTLKGFIEIAFKNMSIEVSLFETGEKCIERFIQVKPELVILDFHLNSSSSDAANGIEILKKIKKISPASGVIMLTRNDNIDVALESFHHGASDYVIKTESLFFKIKHPISAFFSKKELEDQNQQKEKLVIETTIENKELSIKNEEKKKRAVELIIINKKIDFQNEENEKQTAELVLVNTRKIELEKSKLVLEEKNKDITDSINYAKRIQQAKLPRKEEIYASFPESFVLFKPKDIVSGDFYFFHTNSQAAFIGAADCTGHGVPGAFMSMLGSEKLDHAVTQSSDISEILKHLNKGIKNSLHQSSSSESTRDGMDIAVCAVDTENRIIKYAGANRPLWFIRNKKREVEEIKGTKMAIGGLTEDDQHFDSHELKLNQGDTFYISTDGYGDQFGGRNGKKLMTKKFKDILLDIQDKSMQEQKQYLDDFVENWKTGLEQVDDILVIGVRL